MTSIRATGIREFILATDALSQQGPHRDAITRSALAAGNRLRAEMGRELARSQGRKRVQHGNPFTCEEVVVTGGGGAQILEDESRLQPIGTAGGVFGALPATVRRGGIAGVVVAREPDYAPLFDRAEDDFVTTLEDVWDALIESTF